MKKNRPCLNGLVLSAPVVGSHGPPSLSGPACQLCVCVETSGTPKPRVSKDSSLKRRITSGRPYRGAIKGPGETATSDASAPPRLNPQIQVLPDAGEISRIVAEGGVEIGPHARGEELLRGKAVAELVDLGASLERNPGGRIGGAIGHGIRRREREGRVDGRISFGQERRERDGVDERDRGRTAPGLAFARIASSVGPGAPAALVAQVAGARDEPHPEQLAPTEPRLDDLLAVSSRNLGKPAGAEFRHGTLAFTPAPNSRTVPCRTRTRAVSELTETRPGQDNLSASACVWTIRRHAATV